MNRIDPSVMPQQEQATTVLEQTNYQEDNQQKHIKVALLQIKKFQALET